VLILFSILERETFPTFGNFRTVATQTVVVAIAALGATCVIISGGVDLSVGSVVALCTVVTALVLRAGHDPLAAASAGIAAGALCGLVNGVIVTGLRIVPFIATLGMLSIARGTAKVLADGQTVRPEPSWIEELMSTYPLYGWMIFSPGVWLMIVLSLAVAFLLGFTVFGRHIFAVGSSEPTARLCGLPVSRIKIQIYALAGAFSGLAGLMAFSRLTVGDPTGAIGLELDVIAAVVIGGGSLSGGEGSVAGTLVGAFILQFLRNGCNLIGVDNYVQDMIIGSIIIGAVAVDQLRKRLGH
jgi:ribose transport system permease protein